MSQVCFRKVCPPLMVYTVISIAGILALLLFDTNRRDVLPNIILSGVWVALWTFITTQACCHIAQLPIVWLLVALPVVLWIALVVMVLQKEQ